MYLLKCRDNAKKYTTICYIPKRYIKFKDSEMLKGKHCENTYHANSKQKKVRIVKVILNKTVFGIIKITREKREII